MAYSPRKDPKHRVLAEYSLTAAEERRREHAPCSENVPHLPLSRTDCLSPKSQMESEKRLRREIANSNERRRMQSINAGFVNLRHAIPHLDEEKLSKAAILQHTVEYIQRLKADCKDAKSRNGDLARMLGCSGEASSVVGHGCGKAGSPSPKRRKRETESSDEGICLRASFDHDEGGCAHPRFSSVHRELVELRTDLERERQYRHMLEEQVKSLKNRLKAAGEIVRVDNPLDSVIKCESIPPSQSGISAAEPRRSRQSQVSRQNLETIMEAIRHLEGNDLLLDSPKTSQSDSERDSCVSSESESSGRISPSFVSASNHPPSRPPFVVPHVSSLTHVNHNSVSVLSNLHHVSSL